jgi:PrgI family protein
MATYKVIQDIEAEDKLIGPLTLRQFIYAAIACIAGYLSFLAVTKGAAFMLVILLPIVFTGGFFAFPWKGEQPTEIWALAKIRFMIKPRRRIWDQSGVKELVTITAPKQVQTEFTNGLSQNEVESRLRALADTIDSRGWAIKNSNVNMYGQPALVMADPNSDRLLGPSAFPQEVEAADIMAADDMMDEQNNRVAQQVDNMIEASARAHRERIVESLQQPEPPKIPSPPKPPANNYWFLNQAGQSASVPNDMVTFNTQVVTPGTPVTGTPDADDSVIGSLPDEQQLVETLEARKRELPMAAYYGHLHTIQPLSAQGKQQVQTTQIPTNGSTPQTTNQSAPMNNNTAGPGPQYPAPPIPPQYNSGTSVPNTGTQAQPVTPAQQAAILQLASNDDLNVATIAREAQRSGLSDGEVVIKLH